MRDDLISFCPYQLMILIVFYIPSQSYFNNIIDYMLLSEFIILMLDIWLKSLYFLFVGPYSFYTRFPGKYSRPFWDESFYGTEGFL